MSSSRMTFFILQEESLCLFTSGVESDCGFASDMTKKNINWLSLAKLPYGAPLFCPNSHSVGSNIFPHASVTT